MRKPRRNQPISKNTTHTTGTRSSAQASPLPTSSIAFYCIAAMCIAIPFGLGKYIEFNTPGAYDSGAYVYSAKHVLDGARIGIDEKVSARMGTLLVNMLGVKLFGFNETGPKIIQTLFQSAALILMFLVLAKLYGKWPAAWAVLIAATFLSAPLIAKTGNVKEQYMIACMMIGISCLVLRQLGGAWGWCMLAGAFLAWGPLFKQTGLSAIGATGLFVLTQPLLGQRTWKQTGCDILFLLAGAVLSIGPVYLWLGSMQAPAEYWPYAKIWRIFFPGQGPRISAYISKGRTMIPMSELGPRVFRYYKLLILPVALALASILWGMVSFVTSKINAAQRSPVSGRFLLLFTVWWILDMAFIWISPRSYEQYYLPLNASAAMLGAYALACFFQRQESLPIGLRIGLITVSFVAALGMSQHIFTGIYTSPHSKTIYKSPTTGEPEKRRGFSQKLREISARKNQGFKRAWESIGHYIRRETEPTDTMFVWGWYPGMYVQAQRMSAASHAYTSEMHVRNPNAFSEMIQGIVADFEQCGPRYIIDSQKRHFPWNRPLLELWPRLPKGFQGLKKATFLPANDQALIDRYNQEWSAYLEKQFGPEEAQRFRAMKPLREYIRQNFKGIRQFGAHILFEMDPTKIAQESK
jgi:hypothetical protein